MKKKNTVDINQLININTKIGAYLLGLLWSDGYVDYTQIVFTTTQPDDEYFVEMFNKIGNWNIYYIQPKQITWKRRCNITMSNKILCNFLLEHGFRSKSTISADKILHRIPENLQRFFLLGVCDGDGSFYCNKQDGAYRFSISSSYEYDWSFVEKILKEQDILYKIERTKSNNGNYSKIHISNGKEVLKFGQYLYVSIEEDEIGLLRKYNKYLEIKTTYKPKSSKYKGVIYNKKYNNWKAFGSQKNNQSCKWIGTFKTEELAHIAVQEYYKNI